MTLQEHCTLEDGTSYVLILQTVEHPAFEYEGVVVAHATIRLRGTLYPVGKARSATALDDLRGRARAKASALASAPPGPPGSGVPDAGTGLDVSDWK